MCVRACVWRGGCPYLFLTLHDGWSIEKGKGKGACGSSFYLNRYCFKIALCSLPCGLFAFSTQEERVQSWLFYLVDIFESSSEAIVWVLELLPSWVRQCRPSGWPPAHPTASFLEGHSKWTLMDEIPLPLPGRTLGHKWNTPRPASSLMWLKFEGKLTYSLICC